MQILMLMDLMDMYMNIYLALSIFDTVMVSSSVATEDADVSLCSSLFQCDATVLFSS